MVTTKSAQIRGHMNNASWADKTIKKSTTSAAIPNGYPAPSFFNLKRRENWFYVLVPNKSSRSLPGSIRKMRIGINTVKIMQLNFGLNIVATALKSCQNNFLCWLKSFIIEAPHVAILFRRNIGRPFPDVAPPPWLVGVINVMPFWHFDSGMDRCW